MKNAKELATEQRLRVSRRIEDLTHKCKKIIWANISEKSHRNKFVTSFLLKDKGEFNDSEDFSSLGELNELGGLDDLVQDLRHKLEYEIQYRPGDNEIIISWGKEE